MIVTIVTVFKADSVFSMGILNFYCTFLDWCMDEILDTLRSSCRQASELSSAEVKPNKKFCDCDNCHSV